MKLSVRSNAYLESSLVGTWGGCFGVGQSSPSSAIRVERGSIIVIFGDLNPATRVPGCGRVAVEPSGRPIPVLGFSASLLHRCWRQSVTTLTRS